MEERPGVNRKPLREMTPQKRADWYLEQRAELEDFCSYAQRYTMRRRRRGSQTFTDARYEQFFSAAAELLAGLDELRQEAMEQVAQQEEGNQE